MTGSKDWPHLRQHGRHRATPPVIKETDLSSSLAAALPGPMPRPLTQPVVAAMAPAQPESTAECVWCHAINFASQVPDVGRGPHCTDYDACNDRWYRGHALHDAQDEAVALAAHLGPDEPGFGPETCTEDEEPAEDRAPASVAEVSASDDSDEGEL